MKKIVLILIACTLFTDHSWGQADKFRVVFYNVENLFDIQDNPQKDDSEFTPEGSKTWTYNRYQNKLNNISKVITSIGEWGCPDLVGLCEVENSKAMNDLTKYSPLKAQNYQYIITQCADRRGINVALMYQRDKFKYLDHKTYKIKFPKQPKKVTRDLLHVTGQVLSKDTLDIFICHFPSRAGGEKSSEPGRIHVASILKFRTDSLMKVRKNANIIIMGDLNDEPFNESIAQKLKALPFDKNTDPKSLYNLFYKYTKQKNTGTYKYRKEWNILDQIIVSGNLFDRSQRVYVLPESAEIFQRDFLMTKDGNNGGKRPKKTYNGRKHEGGYSDHLPVYVDFHIKSK